jgi:hypothetical protein
MLYLVQGRRFLLTFTNFITLFDLCHSQVPPRLTAKTPASVCLQEVMVTTSDFCIWISNPKRIFFWCLRSSTLIWTLSLNIRQISAQTGRNPEINKIASLEGIPQSDVHFHSLTFDRLIFDIPCRGSVRDSYAPPRAGSPPPPSLTRTILHLFTCDVYKWFYVRTVLVIYKLRQPSTKIYIILI